MVPASREERDHYGEVKMDLNRWRLYTEAVDSADCYVGWTMLHVSSLQATNNSGGVIKQHQM